MALSLAKTALFGILTAGLAVDACPTAAKRTGTCTSINQRKAWHNLTNDEKTSFINAELCIMNSPTRSGWIPGAKNLWDELHYTHIYQGNYMHYVGHFLPWHRWFVRTHEILLQECGYEGGHPYWDEPYDLANAPLNESSIFDPVYGFGGNGAGGGGGCIEDGPFANVTLHINKTSTEANYCISRNLNQDDLDQANTTNIAECMAYSNYTTAWECWNGYPHGAGHGAVGGLMSDPIESNGDPTFFLHHAWLDKMWAEWQTAWGNNYSDIGGPNVPPEYIIESSGLGFPSASILDYNGDGPDNHTSLNHVLWMDNIVDNVTIADVMELGGSTICAEYI